MKYEEAMVLDSVETTVEQMMIRFAKSERVNFYEEEVGMLESYFAMQGCLETTRDAVKDRVKICAQFLARNLITSLSRSQFEKAYSTLMKLTQEDLFLSR